MALFTECVCICFICLVWEGQRRTLCCNFLWLEVTELPVLISALVSQRSLPRSRRESTRVQHVHSPYSVVDVKLSLGSLAKTTTTHLQALGGSEHHCALWVLSEGASFYPLLCRLYRVQIFFLMNSIIRNRNQEWSFFWFQWLTWMPKSSMNCDLLWFGLWLFIFRV